MRKLWTERRSSHEGELVNFTSVLSYPKPVNERGVPVWSGGKSNPALRRVAEYGDRWIGFNLLPESVRQDQAHRRAAQGQWSQALRRSARGVALHQSDQTRRSEALS
jgi:alkanesulfonate monooxygenase SsuD/methylene tetrahydromethanopterin reductase-like flavin-dependent oxidoreductase (luciferase family)